MARINEAPRIQATRIHGQITLYVAVNLIIIEKQELFFLIEEPFIFIERHSSLIRDVERSIENFVNLSRHSGGAANAPRAKRRPPALLRQSRGPCAYGNRTGFARIAPRAADIVRPCSGKDVCRRCRTSASRSDFTQRSTVASRASCRGLVVPVVRFFLFLSSPRRSVQHGGAAGTENDAGD